MGDFIQIRGIKIHVEVIDIKHRDLMFYPENPRIYSMVHPDRSEPSQEEIEEQLLKSEHVRSLVQRIETHGGLIDPIIVRDGDKKIVVEGNCRLAAYRKLSFKEPLKWGKIRCKLLPKDIEEESIFALLGEYHLLGKKDWQPYEQAGYLYRMHKQQNFSIDKLANDIGIKLKSVKHLIKVYEFMVENHAIPSRWSYYDEYLKSTIINKARKEYPELDKIVVKKIKAEEIPKAVEIRDGLKKIAEAGGKTLKKFVNEQVSFKKSVERADNTGKTDSYYKKLNTFRLWIIKNETKSELAYLDSDDPLLKKCLFEIKKIHKRTEELIKKLDKNK